MSWSSSHSSCTRLYPEAHHAPVRKGPAHNQQDPVVAPASSSPRKLLALLANSMCFPGLLMLGTVSRPYLPAGEAESSSHCQRAFSGQGKSCPPPLGEKSQVKFENIWDAYQQDLSPCFCAQGPGSHLGGHKNPEDPPTLPGNGVKELFECRGVQFSLPPVPQTADLFHVRRKVILSIILPGGIVFTFILKLTILSLK